MNWLKKALTAVGLDGSTDAPLQILLVDDTPANLQVLMHTLKALGHKLVAANSGARAIELAQKSRPSLILLDVMMPDMDGFAVCAHFKSDDELKDIPIIFCSALDDTASKVKGFELGAADFITKPFQPEEVIARVTTQLTLARLLSNLDKRNRELERELALAEEYRGEALERLAAPLLGSSAAIVQVRAQISTQASSMEPLLIASEISCGSEGVARAIHGESKRKNGPFVVVDCTRPHGLESSRVFDRLDEDAASHRTKLELAEGGTLYLDDVQRLPAALQEQLASLLAKEEGTSSHDVRVIAAVSSQGEEGRFPEEYDRRLVQVLKENPLHLPSLAQRREDLPELVRHFVRRHSSRLGQPISEIPDETMSRLTAYAWPGNLRELDDVMRRSVIQTKSNVLQVDERLLSEGIPLGSYRLVKKLGAGGMGEVWKATHQLLSRPAAVKLIKNQASDDDPENARLQRFEREARITAGLTSRNTVELYDFGVTEEGSFYYIMELLDGIDLHDAIEQYGPMPPARVVQLLIQCCSSLAEAHLAGLVHRDIKPANLFICRLGLEVDVLKVLDFGLVTDNQESESPRLTRQDSFCGTPSYMSPEAAMSSADVTGKSDMYAIGCVAYWLLTGTDVFEAPNSMAVMMKHITEEAPPPSGRNVQAIPAPLEELIMACLRKKPEERPSAEELWQGLIDVELEGFSMQEAYEWWARNLEGNGESGGRKISDTDIITRKVARMPTALSK